MCTQANKELEDLKSERKKLGSEQESLQQRLHTLQSKVDEDAKKHETTVSKLQAQLKERGTRRKVSKRIRLL